MKPVNQNPREVREALKELLDHDTPASAKRTIREAVQLIATMQADLRRLGLTEYNTEEETND